MWVEHLVACNWEELVLESEELAWRELEHQIQQRDRPLLELVLAEPSFHQRQVVGECLVELPPSLARHMGWQLRVVGPLEERLP